MFVIIVIRFYKILIMKQKINAAIRKFKGRNIYLQKARMDDTSMEYLLEKDTKRFYILNISRFCYI